MNMSWKPANTTIQQLLENQRLLLALRMILGSIFIVSAVLKLPHQAEFIQIVNSYGILPYGLAELYGFLLPWAELFIGCLLLLGLFTRLASGIGIALITSFIIANVSATYGLAGSGNDLCGCFGEALPLSHRDSLIIDVLMLAMAVPLIIRQSRLLSVRLASCAGFCMKFASIALLIIMLTLAVPSAVIQAGGNDTVPDMTTQETPPDSSAEYASVDGTPVFLFFYADWCHYCQEEKPVIDELEKEYGNRISFIRINSQDNQPLMEEWNISTIPTMILNSGTDTEGEYRRFAGFTGKDILSDSLEAMLGESCQEPVTEPADAEGCGAPEISDSYNARVFGKDIVFPSRLLSTVDARCNGVRPERSATVRTEAKP